MTFRELHQGLGAATSAFVRRRMDLFLLASALAVMALGAPAIVYIASGSNTARKHLLALLGGNESIEITRIVLVGQGRRATVTNEQALNYIRRAAARCVRAGSKSDPRKGLAASAQYMAVLTFADGSSATISVCPFTNLDGFEVGVFQNANDVDETMYRAHFDGPHPDSVIELMVFLNQAPRGAIRVF